MKSYCQQFHQHQQHDQPPLTSNNWTQNTTTYDIGNPGPVLGQAWNCDAIKLLMESHSYPSDNWISLNDSTDINNKICTDQNIDTLSLNMYDNQTLTHYH